MVSKTGRLVVASALASASDVQLPTLPSKLSKCLAAPAHLLVALHAASGDRAFKVVAVLIALFFLKASLPARANSPPA
jgi:hypothetical protein